MLKREAINYGKRLRYLVNEANDTAMVSLTTETFRQFLDVAIAEMQKEPTCDGFTKKEIAIVEMLTKNGVKPQDLKALCNNVQFAWDVVHTDIEKIKSDTLRQFGENLNKSLDEMENK